MFDMLETQNVECPYCGESFETNVDASNGSQEYVEDCYVCCRPIVFVLNADDDGHLVTLQTRRDDE
jgi:hypothetical protein